MEIRLADITCTRSTAVDWFLTLPRSLKSLTLYDLPVRNPDFDNMEAFQEFANVIPGRFPVLKEVKLAMHDLHECFDDWEEFHSLLQSFDKVDVDLDGEEGYDLWKSNEVGTAFEKEWDEYQEGDADDSSDEGY
jgi:hypothetical protein